VKAMLEMVRLTDGNFADAEWSNPK
jgi:hypothetical protein